MSVIGELFGSGLKIKRWLFLVIVGTGMLSYSIAMLFTNQELEINGMIIYALMFVFGFVAIIIGFMMAQRRLLQAIAEYTSNQNASKVNMKELIYDKDMLDRNLKVVAIGDGEGLSAVLKAMKIFSNHVTAIVSVVGKGNARDLNSNINVNGIKKAMVALAENEHEMKDFMNYRNMDTELFGKNAGNMVIQSLANIHNGNLSEAINHMSKIFAINGKVIPATLNQLDIGAILNDGTRVVGKDELVEKISERKSPIEKLFLVPERCEPAPDVIRSIKEADLIVIGPGSLYMGILPILLIREISDAIKKSSATKIYISNIMTEAHQTDNFSVSDYIHVIGEHIGKGLFDYCIVSDSDIMPEYIRRYNQNGSDVVDIDKHILKNANMNLLIEDLTVVDESNNIHHDSQKLAKLLVKILCDNMEMSSNQSTLDYYMVRSKLKKINKKKKKNILFRDVKVIPSTKMKNKR